MCIHVIEVDVQSEIAVWDPDEVVITVQRGTHPHLLITELRALLAIDLGAPTTATGALACFCGEPVTIPGERAAVWAA
ncbi:hypothetical protein ABZ714_08810 [Streptomyces sp. NPDC006798]|uniref:hypothetical protein n=1 Tax=Streptomyces sp. NPDC006798 TaxID=3155462 RepID=UPI0033DC0B5B